MLLDALPEPTPLAQLPGREGEMRYVTQHFTDLQGLKLVPLWAGSLVLMYAFPHGHVPARIAMSAFGAVIALTGAWVAWVTRRYNEWYGFVGGSKIQPEQTPGAGFASLLCLAVMVVFAILPRPSSGNTTPLLTTQIFPVPKCFYACPRSLAIWLRRALYIAAATATLSMTVYGAVTPGFGRASFNILSWSLLLLGLYDHWLLGFLLRPRHAEFIEASHD